MEEAFKQASFENWGTQLWVLFDERAFIGLRQPPLPCSLNNMANECSDTVIFSVVSWVDIIKSHFYLAVLWENHTRQTHKEINYLTAQVTSCSGERCWNGRKDGRLQSGHSWVWWLSLRQGSLPLSSCSHTVQECIPEIRYEGAPHCSCPPAGQKTTMSRKNDCVFDSLQVSWNKHHLAVPSRVIRHYFIAFGPSCWVNHCSEQWLH